ncbi:putative HTH-type transcriptional regulator YbiH [Pandoraea terrae]|uniref:Putative HTH-type transcriptional regulator YbiH n=1 Tax=Pandoraea terrae TaxID=1537710 RepID=A0A5E4UMG5_9BURK|nr:CerR family C-terminal domain-containing protein [Pandoraea terrae]VVE00724.1 putative HTH-type transcriptional regulator YbiH [Pandoraea terrae]
MGRTAKLRHVVDGGYQRGEETRARIVVAAIRLFGEKGFEGASTRDIAAAAGVNAPALQYYFDNKEGVYLACVEAIVARIWEAMEAPVAAAEAVLADAAASDQALIEAFCQIQGAIASIVQVTPDANDWRMFMAREQSGLGPEAGFLLMQERVQVRTSAVTAAIVSRLSGLPLDDPETRLRAMAITGQGMIFRVMPRSVKSSLGWDSIDDARQARIRDLTVEHARDLLRMLAVRRDEHGRAGKPR